MDDLAALREAAEILAWIERILRLQGGVIHLVHHADAQIGLPSLISGKGWRWFYGPTLRAAVLAAMKAEKERI